MFVFLVLSMLYQIDTLTGFAKATKTCPDTKRYWKPLNSKRSLPVLKLTSESVEFPIFFAYTIYILYNPVQEQSLDPFAAHAVRGKNLRSKTSAIVWHCRPFTKKSEGVLVT